MKKKNQKKEPLSPIVKFGILIGAALIVGVIALGINSMRQQKQQAQMRAEQARQESIRKKKEQPKFKDYSSDSKPTEDDSPKLTKDQAIKRLHEDINYGFALMKDTNTISSSRVSSKQLSTAEHKALVNHFDDLDTFNKFNQLVNISTVSGENYYGQGGNNKTYKTSKQGDTYVITGGSVEYKDSGYNTLVYDVNLKYKAGAFRADRWLKVSVDQTSGVITSIAAEGTNKDE